MSEKPTVEQVCQACSALYHNPDAQSKNAASKWLEELQKTVFAWEVADHCLHQKVPTEVLFFASQTIRKKIQYSFHDLPPDARLGLRASLLTNVTNHASSSPAVATQLSVAVADLVIQMMQEWSGSIQDLVSMLRANDATVGCLLDILSVLPEEIDNEWLPLTMKERDEIRYRFGFESGIIYPFIGDCITKYNSSIDILAKAFKCLASWLRFGGEGSLQFETSPLLEACFSAARADVPELVAAGCKALVSACLLSFDRTHHPTLETTLVPRILDMRSLVEKTVAEEDSDRLENLAFVLTQMADNFCHSSMLQPGPEHVAMLHIMTILATQQVDVEIATMTFNFWYNLSDVIYDATTKLPSEFDQQVQAGVAKELIQEQIKSGFRPYFGELFKALLQHVKCDTTLAGPLSSDSTNADLRERVTDLMAETSFIVGAEGLLGLFWGECQKAGAGWNDLEANLFMMGTVAHNAGKDSEVAPQVLRALTTIGPDHHDQLYITVLELFGKLAVWSSTLDEGEAAGLIWQQLVRALSVRKHIQPVVRSIGVLCNNCRSKIAPFFDELTSIVVHADALEISKSDVIDIIKGGSRVASHMPNDKITAATTALCTPIMDKLRKDIDAGTSPVTALDRLATLFKNTNVPEGRVQECVAGSAGTHPLWPVVQTVFPTLSAVLERFAGNNVVIEEGNRCIKYIIRGLGEYAIPLVGPVMEQVTKLFATHKHSSCLYVAQGLVKTFGDNPNFAEGMLVMFRTLSAPTFATLTSGDLLEQLVQNPEIVDDYLRLARSILDKAPAMLLETDLGVPAFQLGSAAMCLRHRDAHETTSHFMRLYVGLWRTEGLHITAAQVPAIKQHLTQLIESYGEQLVGTIIGAATGDLPVMYMADLCDVLFEVHLLDPARCYRFVESAMGHPNIAGSRATDEQKAEFLNTFSQVNNHLSSFRDNIKRFGRFVRNDHNANDDDMD